MAINENDRRRAPSNPFARRAKARFSIERHAPGVRIVQRNGEIPERQSHPAGGKTENGS